MLQNLKNGVATQGYDVLSFFEGNPSKGIDTIASDYNGAQYLFTSREHKQQFETSPEAYIPQYGGYCAFAMLQGKEVIPNTKSWMVKDGKLYFFTRMLFGIIDAKKQWVKDFDDKKNRADTAWKNLSIND